MSRVLPRVRLRSVRRRTAAGAAAVAAVAAVVAGLAACAGGGSAAEPGAARSAAASGAVATRWWSNAAAPASSTIDPARPSAAATALHPSRPDYCGMLSATLVAGRSILPGVSAGDPALLASTEAFVAEIERVAPAEAAGAWRVLGPALVGLVGSGSAGSAVPSLDVGALQQAAADVSADAARNCHLDLSTLTGSARPQPTATAR